MVSTSIAKDHTAEKKVTNFVSKPNFSPNGGSGRVCRGRGLMEISTNSEGGERVPEPQSLRKYSFKEFKTYKYALSLWVASVSVDLRFNFQKKTEVLF